MTGLAERLEAPDAVPYPGAHLGLRWRPLIPSDGPAVAALIRDAEDFDRAIDRTSSQEIADMMEGGGADLMDTIVGLDSEDQVCAVASVRVLRDVEDMAIAVVNAFIAPHWRERGVGRALLFWQDGRARQLLLRVFGADSEVPALVTNIVDAHVTERRRLYIAAGFYARRTFRIMYREIEGAEEAVPARDGYRIVPWDSVDERVVRAVHMDVFTTHFWPEVRGRWWDEAMVELDRRWSFVALSPRDEVAGYLAVGRPAERWVAEGRTEAYVSLLGVSEEHRRHGLSTALMSATLAAAAGSGVSRVGLDVDMDSSSNAHAIYEHWGFVDQSSQVYYTIDH
ncbi:GNAT family N-acetyltransferase [Schaalia naturae]|jgi:GNAT superfamily N-acetyltransferase|uniref:GNAT family N-acetyltransferase n=1 Tax=Schaalia naturae TaxID=635203 RepID=A0ABW2SJQ8_9ACTO